MHDDIDRVCSEFEEQWKTGEPPALAEYLAAANSNGTQVAQELLVLDVTYRRLAGETPAPSDYAQVGSFTDADISAAFEQAEQNISEVQPTHPREIDGYQLVEEIGRGGMGQVFRARKNVSSRDVALKLLPYVLPDAERAARFRREIKAAEQIEHPHVVPVYDCGNVKGQLYFTMKLIEGSTLQDFASGPLDVAVAVELVRQVGEGISAAHEKGVIHRDLKPNNVLIEVGDKPAARVADFGLAVTLDAETRLTASDGLLGTPAYMPPELASGRAETDVRTDVYGVGAVLFYTLTGRPPIDGDSTPEILAKVTTIEPTRPSRLRSEIPSQLDTICLKCLEKRPDDRYPSVGALLDDLNAWSNGQPIAATRPPLLKRTLRSILRHPVKWSLSTTVMIALIAWGVVTIQGRELEEAKKVAGEASKGVEELEGQVVDVRLDQLKKRLGTQNAVIQRIGRILESAAATGAQRQALLDEALNEANKIRSEWAAIDDPTEVDRSIGLAHLELGRIYLRIGKAGSESGIDSATSEFTQADNTFATLLKSEPNNDKYRRGRWLSQRALGDLYMRTGELSAALKCFQAGLAQLGKRGDSPNPALDRAAALDDLGNVWVELQDYKQAELAFQEAFEIRLSHPGTPPRDLSVSLSNLGLVCMKQGRQSEALKHFNEFKRITDELGEAEPNNPLVQRGRWRSRFNISEVYNSFGEFEKEIQILQEAAKITERLLEGDPRNRQFRRDMCVTQLSLGLVLATVRRREESQKAFGLAEELADSLATDDVLDRRARLDIARVFLHIGQDKANVGDGEPSLAALKKCIDQCQAVLGEVPDNTEPQLRIAQAKRAQGDVHLLKKDVAGAQQAYQEAVETLSALLEDAPDDANLQVEVGYTRERLGGIWLRRREHAKAEAEFRACLAIREKLVESDPASVDWRTQVALCRANLGLIADNTNRPAIAVKEYEAAISTFESLNADKKLAPAYHGMLGQLKVYLGRSKEKAAQADEGTLESKEC